MKKLLDIKRWRLLAPAVALSFAVGCTDLDESPTSVITPENFNKTEQEVLGSLASVYSVMRNTQWSYYNLNEVTSDEMIVPTRGSDWFDNGRWLELHRHTWGASSPSGLDDMNGMWNDAFTGVTRANVLLDALQNVTIANQEAVEAEIRTLRAFYYYMLMDMFGGVPLVTSIEIEPRSRASRAEVWQFVVDELNAARSALPDVVPPADNGRMTKGAADAILASTYLNAGVFSTESPSATSYNSCMDVQGACQGAIDAADRILNSGLYSLASDWRTNFDANNATSPENILVVKNLNETGLGLNLPMRTLHYNQFSPTPWNGFAALAEAYNAFDPADDRRNMLLEGPQFVLETDPPEPAFDRAGNPLVFTVDIIDETQAGEGEGTRILKYTPDPDRVAQHNNNDFVYFRLSEIMLIKAEALLAMGNSGEALTLVNTVRARAFEPDQPLAAIDQDAILAERLFELMGEAKRRQDLIRHGQYTRAWEFKQAGADHIVLMPIPQSQLDANPMLTQNPGY